MIESGALWAQPHHDGSAAYVSDPSPALGATVRVRLRAPHDSGVTRADVRVLVDAEPQFFAADVDERTRSETWFSAEIPVSNPLTSYRWLVDGGANDFRWVTGVGVVEHDVIDAFDFRITTHAPAPDWLADAVVYQIFPDRFARTVSREAPDWAVPQQWDDPVQATPPGAGVQWYGGDLEGIEEHLDHIAWVGANTVYLTPIFPGASNHRYDASTFDRVDPLLGGEEALEKLAAAVHARGMRLIGDLTTNHTGVTHEWFRAASADAHSPEAGFYYFRDHPVSYATWLDVLSLPKLNHHDGELRRRLYEGDESIVARWLQPQGPLDGWRIDVANMTGRAGADDVNHDVARIIRRTMHEASPDAVLLAEHGHDYTTDLIGDGWDGTMNYTGTTRPIWSWLRPVGADPLPIGLPGGIPRLPGPNAVAAMNMFGAGIPWTARLHSLNFVSSHDSPRIRTILGSADLVAVAVGLAVTLPGVPMLYSGDEIGTEGYNGEDGRRPFRWNSAEWDRDTVTVWRDLLAARTEHAALRRGGLRWLWVDDEAIVFLRELPGERIMVQARRSTTSPVAVPTVALGCSGPLAGLAGTSDLVASPGDGYELPDDGPAIRLWLLPDR